MTIPTIREIWPSATAVSAKPPVMQATDAQPICTIVLRAAMSLLGHHPNAYLDTEICLSPVGAPKVAANPVAAPPRIDAKMVMTILWRSAIGTQIESVEQFARAREEQNPYSTRIEVPEGRWQNKTCSWFRMPIGRTC